MDNSETKESLKIDEVDAKEIEINDTSAGCAMMPVKIDSQYYNMNHKKRGIAVIFNHEYFDIKGVDNRRGTEEDCNNLNETLEKLGFEVKIHNDLCFESIFEKIKEAVEYDHSDCDCFVMVVLSHGDMGTLYAKDRQYKTEIIWTYFSADKCPTLAGKPKLFFIQACQGDKMDPGITLKGRTEIDGSPSSYRIPTLADFLIAHSTAPGCYSFRNKAHGSCFVQALCKELDYNAEKLDILTLLTFVCQRVAIDFESKSPGKVFHQKKQIPYITTTLTRLLCFKKK